MRRILPITILVLGLLLFASSPVYAQPTTWGGTVHIVRYGETVYCIARAYSLSLASVVAPFEYASLPISVIWDLVLWRVIPTWLTLLGALLTLASGLYVLFRERKQRQV